MKLIEGGEKNTNYFLGLERKQQLDNAISSVRTSIGIVHDSEKIIDEVVNFYITLYTSNNIPDKRIKSYLKKIILNFKIMKFQHVNDI